MMASSTITPAGRTVFHVLAVLLGVLALEVNSQPQGSPAAEAHQQVNRVKAGERRLKGGGKSIHQAQQLGRSVHARSQPPCLTQLGGIQADQQIGQVGEQKFFQIELSHRSCSLRFSRFGTGAFTSSLNFLSLPSTDSRRCSFFSRFLEYFWKAAFMLASLGALKKI